MASEHDPVLRRAARRARSRTRAALDRLTSEQGVVGDKREIQALLDSRLFLPWYYNVQLQSKMPPVEAAGHFLEHGWRDGLLANPLLDFDAVGLSPEQIRAGLLDGSAATYPVRPILDDVQLVRNAPRSAQHPGGVVGFFLEQAEQGLAPSTVRGRTWGMFTAGRRRDGRGIELIEASGLFDVAHYERQVGRVFLSPRAALWHFLEQGEPQALSAHPLFEPAWYRASSKLRNAGLFAHFLRSGQVEHAAGPHFDGKRYLTAHPDATGHPGGALGHFLAHADAETLTPAVNDVDPAPLGGVLAAVREAATAYGEQAAMVREPSRPVARWYVDRGLGVVDTAGTTGDHRAVCIVSDARTWQRVDPSTVASLTGQKHQQWQLRVAVDDGDDVPHGLATAMAADPRISVVPTSAETWADRANAVLAVGSESWCAFWTPQQTWSPDMLSALLDAAADQPAVMGEVVVEDAEGDEWLGPIAADLGALWRRPRTLAGVLVRRSVLDGSPFRPEAASVYQWDFLLRAQVQPSYVPVVAVRLDGEETLPDDPGVDSTDDHVLRASHLIDWTAVRDAVGSRTPGRISLLIPTYRDWRYTRLAVRTALETARSDVEIVVVDNGSRREVTAVLSAAFAAEPRVHVHRLPVNTNFATGSNLAFARSSGDTVVFLNNDTEPRAGWLEPLTAALDEPGVLGAQPLLLYPDDSIQTAGTLFYGTGAIAGHLLAGFPQEDLRPEVQLRFHAVTAACMAAKASAVADAAGFDPHYANGMEDVDLCLRLGHERGGHFVTVRDSVVVHHESKSPGRFAGSESNRLRFLKAWGSRLPQPDSERWREAGFEVTALRPLKGLPVTGARTAVEPLLRRTATTVTEGPGRGLPRLRWAIKISAWGGPRGDGWGDVAFARDLAHALRSWGQEVVVDRAGAHQRLYSDYLDDVTLTLRGLVSCSPQPGATNVLWVISHPELVTADELGSGYDLVYAASNVWAEEASRRLAHEVRPLLQATNVSRFSPDGPAMSGLDTLFVGRTRRIFRPIVRDSLAVGADLALFGDGWEEFIDPGLVRAEHLPNDDLPAAYRGARIVLNDHWEDMAQQGFFSNRLFDAVASGARVVSDGVPGLEDLFGPSVQAYTSLDDLAELLASGSTRWADDEAIRENAKKVAAAHSFENRARALLADVLDIRGVPHDLRDD